MTTAHKRAAFLKEITDIVHAEFKANPRQHKSYIEMLCWVVEQLTQKPIVTLGEALGHFDLAFTSAPDEDSLLHTLSLVMELFHPVCISH